MKKDIHPTLHPVIFRDASSGTDFTAYSTLTTEEVEKVKGVDHYVYRLDISSASHPFYTGQAHMMDTSGRVEKFRKKMEKAQAAAA
ncbi:MAG TPA: type B 50S ribosomal protein L31 [Candidatus Gracilibacteria bacterium]